MDNNNVLIERLFDVPVAQMWEIWTKPVFVNQWFGSKRDRDFVRY